MTAMSSPATLVLRLRMLADEIEAAHRYGVPIPPVVGASGYEYGDASFHLEPAEFDAWADYCDQPDVTPYEHEGFMWRRTRADVNGLALTFSTCDAAVTP